MEVLQATALLGIQVFWLLALAMGAMLALMTCCNLWSWLCAPSPEHQIVVALSPGAVGLSVLVVSTGLMLWPLGLGVLCPARAASIAMIVASPGLAFMVLAVAAYDRVMLLHDRDWDGSP